MYKTNRQEFFFQTAVIFLSVCLLFVFYHKVFSDLNGYAFSPSGDGLKNYYACLYHAKFDSAFLTFEGMNYPFYEHSIFTDAQLPFSWLFKILGVTEYGVGLLNLFMLLSFPICALLIFKILRHYGVSEWWSLFASVAIAFMSPQIHRLTGHFSLSYVFAIPGLWWMIILSLKGNRFKWSALILVYLMFFFFMHPYLGLILCLFALVFWMVQIILDSSNRKSDLLEMIIQGILPILLFQLIVLFTDTHENRLNNPFGFFEYYAGWSSVFVPHDGPFASAAASLNLQAGNWEAWNYVGMGSTLFLLVILVYMTLNRREIEIRKWMRTESFGFFLSAYLILLFSFCFPLKYDLFKGVADHIGPLKQFRVLGRFGWIFFYAFTVFMVVGLFQISQRVKKPLIIRSIFAAGILLYAIEITGIHQTLGTAVSQAKNPFRKEDLNKDYKDLLGVIERTKPDALMILPFHHLSSENILLMGTEHSSYDSYTLSYHSGKPLMNALSSRMSFSETILFNNFFSPDFVEKELTYYLPEHAKIMVIRNNDEISPDEERLLKSSDLFYENASFHAYLLDLKKWNDRSRFEEVKKGESLAKHTFKDSWRSRTDSTPYVYESFNKYGGVSLGGDGALHGNKDQYEFIYVWDTRNVDTGTYQISFWYNLMEDRPDVLAVAEQDSIGNKGAFWFDQMEVAQSTMIVENWCMVTLDIQVSKEIEKVNIFLNGNGRGEAYSVDELLIRKMDQDDLFRRETVSGREYLIYNNYWLRADSFSKSSFARRKGRKN